MHGSSTLPPLAKAGKRYDGWEKGVITMYAGDPQPNKECNAFCNHRPKDHPDPRDA